MKNRIIFEEIPRGTEYLQTIIESMQQDLELQIDYPLFSKRNNLQISAI